MNLTVHPGAERWGPSPHDLRLLETRFPGRSYQAHLYPRSLVGRIYGRSSEPWAFRAFTREGVSYLFVDQTETPESIAWLVAHELTHQNVNRDRKLKQTLVEARPQDAGAVSDFFHRVDPEERLADGVASNLVGKRLDRDWWREKTPVSEPSPFIHSMVYGGLELDHCRCC